MYPHPTPPINLSKYTTGDWEQKLSCEASESLEPPFDEEGELTLRAFLRLVERGSKTYREDKSEIDTFMLKFNRMLFDGVTVERTCVIDESSSEDEFPYKALMKLWHLPEDSWEDASLQLTRRIKSPSEVSRFPADFQYPLRYTGDEENSFKVTGIVSISTEMPENIILASQKKMSDEETKKRRKRFVSFEMRNGTKVMFFARTGKDASLLSCGLKLLIERVQINL